MLRFKTLLFVFSFLSMSVHAMTNLKQVQVMDGNSIDLYFDAKLSPNQIKIDYINDIIQLTLNDVSVYPAKISTVNGGEITKVFAYQYGPKTVRARFSVKGKAEAFKNRFQLSNTGKVMGIHIATPGVAKRAPAVVTHTAAAQAAATAAPEKSEPVDTEEKALLERILKADHAEKAAEAANEKNAEKPIEKPAAKVAKKENTVSAFESQPIHQSAAVGAKPASGMAKPFFMLSFVIFAFIAGAFGFKKILEKGASKNKIIANLQAKMGKKGKMIEVLANHHLGPKKSIAMVKIGNRTLVLGVTNESVNLITQLDSAQGIQDEDLFEQIAENEMTKLISEPVVKSAPAPKTASAAAGATAAGPQRPVAAAVSNSYKASEPSVAISPQVPPQMMAQKNNNIRAQIRSRIEGMKQL